MRPPRDDERRPQGKGGAQDGGQHVEITLGHRRDTERHLRIAMLRAVAAHIDDAKAVELCGPLTYGRWLGAQLLDFADLLEATEAEGRWAA